MLVLKHALTRGRVPALFTAVGVLVADLVRAMVSVVGLTALLVSSQMAFDLVAIQAAPTAEPADDARGRHRSVVTWSLRQSRASMIRISSSRR